jgi:hypothetical protein
MRAEVLAAALRRDQERCATIHAIMARKLAARRGVGRRAPVANPAQSSDIENTAEFPDRSAYGTAFDPG